MVGRRELHVFQGSTLTARRYRDEILEPYVRLLSGAVGPQFVFMDGNTYPYRAGLVDEYIVIKASQEAGMASQISRHESHRTVSGMLLAEQLEFAILLPEPSRS